MKEPRRSASSKSLREKYPKGFVLPESEIQELVFNLRVGEAHAAAMWLLVIGEAVKAIVEDKTESRRETNVRLIKQIESEEGCRPIQCLIEAIIAAIEHGAEGIYAACLTITRFFEFAFEYPPDHSMASRLYKNKLSKIG
ncbi:MAG: hypothetical protein AABO57_26730 [Acidobacteriota bacterium]